MHSERRGEIRVLAPVGAVQQPRCHVELREQPGAGRPHISEGSSLGDFA